MEAIAGEGLLCLKLLGCNTRIHFQCNKVLTDNLSFKIGFVGIGTLVGGAQFELVLWLYTCIKPLRRYS